MVVPWQIAHVASNMQTVGRALLKMEEKQRRMSQDGGSSKTS